MRAGKVNSAAAAAAASQRQQEDAQEFLSFLLDSAHQELLRLRAAHAAQLGGSADPSSAGSGNGASVPVAEGSGSAGAAAEGGNGDEEWLMAGRSKKKKAVTRGSTSLQARRPPLLLHDGFKCPAMPVLAALVTVPACLGELL